MKHSRLFATLAVLFPESAGKNSEKTETKIPLASHWFVPVSMFNHFYAKELWSELILAMIYPAWRFIDFIFNEDVREGVKEGCYGL